MGYQSDKVTIDNSEYSTSVDGLQEEIDGRMIPKRIAAEHLATAYEFLAEQRGGELRFSLDRRITALRECGTFLEYHVSPDRVKLAAANFCKDRLCPLCNWRRSLKMFAQISRVMDYLEEKENFRYLFLTLTVRNCPGEDLSDTLDMMLQGWYHLYNSQNGVFRGDSRTVQGTLRILEITYNRKAKTFHPHFHVILAVRPDYFAGRNYIRTEQWVEMWRNACGLTYNPTCWIEKIQPIVTEGERGGIKSAVAEVAKYPFKDTDWANQHGQERQDVLFSLITALRGRRLVAFAGCFACVRKLLALDDVEQGDLANVQGLRDDVRDVVVRLCWRVGNHYGAGGYVVYIVPPEQLKAERAVTEKEYHLPEDST